MSPERVAVVVVSFNSSAVLPGLVESLDAGTAGVPYELVVADNASTDGSADLVRRLAPAATVVEMGRNAGYAAGINAAVAVAGPHTAVLALNPDVRLTPGCVPTLLAALREPGVGIVVPRLLDAGGDVITSIRRAPTLPRAFGDALIGASRVGRVGALGEVVTDPARYRSASDIEWAEGSTQLISAQCWQRCGGWDESFFLYSEEVDFHLRTREAGLRVRYVPTATATHLEGDSGTSPRLWSLLVANRLLFFRRRNGLAPTTFFWLALVLREGTRALVGSQISRSAIRVLFRPAMLRAERGPRWLERV
ncbi:glycosyltransferase family 2 protein [Nocardioides sp. LS1]|uniref:glycosyltransferase family 2 protein n=1 Tax=Nocardioides sp. LS1 TaxID=1027620 RepID=UPI000F61D4BE|nr:glycosyltransferase family 2 protein [Nocardioides sp. LS1]GCD91329.1 glycosyl transferase [Nocardioides sp. LS1]